MAVQAKSQQTPEQSAFHSHVSHAMREGIMWSLFCLSGYLLLSLFTYSPLDPGWSYTGSEAKVLNSGGPAGAWFADVFLYLFGIFAYLFPIMLSWSAVLVFRRRNPDDSVNINLVLVRWLGFFITLASGCALAALHTNHLMANLPTGTGGALGTLLGNYFKAVFSSSGASLMMLALFLSGFTLFTGVSWFTVMDFLGGLVLKTSHALQQGFLSLQERHAAKRARQERVELIKKEQKKEKGRKQPRIEPVINAPKPSARVEKERQVPLFEADPNSELPPLALLDPAKQTVQAYSQEALQAMSRQVELKFADFDIDVAVVAVHPGPVVTLYELQLAAGTKVSKISGLSKDLARALSTVAVRVVEVIPGKSVIGLEIPNEYREMVFLSEVLQSETYESSKSPLTLALGKDIAGNPMCADLAKMPHALIAGTTGSGKSVAINAMILSLLYKSKPDEVRMIMVDPKMLELSVYEGIPHLLTPVVTDMQEAANALRWCVGEMERRYRLMASLGVRNITGYNRKVKEAIKKGEPIKDPLFQPEPTEVIEAMAHPTLEPLPFIVVIIDELADMMMMARKKVEELIARLAQKARASGIHLILATQRPSVDVITGLIKANIPTRIAFQVSSRVDSRTILDQMGAEHLLGHGDMLYMGTGSNIPQRMHGAFVDDNEVHRVVKHLKASGQPDYLEEIVQEATESVPGFPAENGDTEDNDPLYDEAVRIVTETRRASISGVQRRLKIGYNRAARMIEEMERTGIVGPAETNGSRTVLAPPPPKD
ncbi:MAG: DNA translocase FtsK 4TM domain-containing protein [Candidatus Thiodiazotropha taylori]|nr:DNA translocase FtsK 4TM domain-containing protein [Candidatus Thiodiazotropha taylori]MCW4324375.1 DNA translocase FtsK 4TM domain-containing protein [Candidatus Thiodiazotropha taylori]